MSAIGLPEMELIRPELILSNFLILDGTEKYTDLYIAKFPSFFGLHWKETKNSLSEKYQGLLMIPLIPFTGLVKHLLSEKPLYDGSGDKISRGEYTRIRDCLLHQGNPWRTEWLNAKFGRDTITYPKFDGSGRFVEVTEDLEEDTLARRLLPKISLKNWVENPTSQGLPSTNNSAGSLQYWTPRKGSVATFKTGPYWHGLDCGESPRLLSSTQGTRPMIVKE